MSASGTGWSWARVWLKTEVRAPHPELQATTSAASRVVYLTFSGCIVELIECFKMCDTRLRATDNFQALIQYSDAISAQTGKAVSCYCYRSNYTCRL